jgi:hypothetical protein
MPVAVAYLSGNTLSYEPGIFKRGTIGFNLSTSLQGNYNWWNAVDQDANKLLIYSDTFSTNATSEANAIPSAWATTDLTDASLLGVVNSVPELIGQPKFTNAKDALTWLQGRGIYFIVKDGYENIVTNGLVLSVDAGWYSSYPGSGTAITDISGEGNNGVLVGVPVLQSGNGGTLNFDGADDRITFSNTLTEIGLINQSPASFEAWVRFNSLSTPMHIIDGSDNCFHLAVESTVTGANIYLWNGVTYHSGSIPSAVVGQWYHIVGVQETSELKIYINGQLAINGTLSSGASNLVTSGSKYLALGYWQGNTGRYLNGNLAIARVYNRALTASEIQQNYNAQSYRFGANSEYVSSGLMTYVDARDTRSYPGSGTVWYDLSGNGNDFTFSSTPSISGGIFDNGGSVYAYRNAIPVNSAIAGYTLEAQFKINSSLTSSWQNVTQNGAGDPTRHMMWYNGGSNSFLALFHTPNSYNNISNTLTLDKWYYLQLSYSPLNIGSNGRKAWLNGVEVTVNNTGAGNATPSGYFSIGVDSNLASNKSDMSYAFVRYYNRGLTTSEVQQNYYQGNIVTSNLILGLDASNLLSFQNGATTTYSLIGSTTGSLNNGVAFNSSNGGSWQFDNVDDHIALPDDIGYVSSVSVFAWFKSNGAPGSGYHIICGGEPFEISVPWPDGAIRSGIRTSAGRFVSNHGSGLNDGNWHYVGFTFNGSTKLSYIDGVLVGTQDSITGTLVSSFAGRLLGWYGSGGYLLNGNIGSYYVYNSALTSTQVIQNFNAQKARFGR